MSYKLLKFKQFETVSDIEFQRMKLDCFENQKVWRLSTGLHVLQSKSVSSMTI